MIRCPRYAMRESTRLKQMFYRGYVERLEWMWYRTLRELRKEYGNFIGD